ncbi:hypothetical protein [Armatimonas sp.]|uniref:hypothetical protein n=1 Tax=Armatimonas sp. TaxID=1872638 RepID=UPI003752C854
MSEKLDFFNSVREIIEGSEVCDKDRGNPWLRIPSINGYKVSLGFYVTTTDRLYLEIKIPKAEKLVFDFLSQFIESTSNEFNINILGVSNRSGNQSSWIFCIECDKEGYDLQEMWVRDNYKIFIEAMKWLFSKLPQT